MCLYCASTFCYRASVKPAGDSKRRSGCPVNVALELLGDRWSLLIIRDLMFRGLRTYRQFLKSDEGIATNILADRLQKLTACGIIAADPGPRRGRKVIYRLTDKGIALAPVLVELILWAARYEKTDAPPAVVRKMDKERGGFIAEVRRRWKEDDLAPMTPSH